MADSRNEGRVVLSWSGGKDCALALRELLKDGHIDVVGLFTTVTEGHDRVSMHGIRRVLVEAQSASLAIPVRTVYIPKDCTNEAYERTMASEMGRLLDEGVCTVAFGDIFLEDVRAHREAKLARLGMRALFPIWGRDTGRLARDFVKDGFKAVVTCVDTEQLDPSFSGRAFDKDLLDELPDAVDPCGENGEFHTFVHDGPCFEVPVAHRPGERVLREGRFQYTDILPL